MTLTGRMNRKMIPANKFSLSIQTERLHVRELRLNDVSFIVRLLNEPSFLKNIGDKGVRTEQDAELYIREAGFRKYSEFGFGMFLVEKRVDATPIGICGLLQRDFLPNPDLGFAFLESAHGAGFGTEAARGVMSWATREVRLKKLSAFTSISNAASIRVLLKNGFQTLGEKVLPGRVESSHVLEWVPNETEYTLN